MAGDNKTLLALAAAAGAGLVGWVLTRNPSEAKTPPTGPKPAPGPQLGPAPAPPQGALQVTGHIVRPPDIFGADTQHQVGLGQSFNMMLPIDVTTNQRTQLTIIYIDAAAGSALFGLGGGELARRQQTIILEPGRNTPLVPSPTFIAQSPGGHNVGAALTLPSGAIVDKGNWDGIFSVTQTPTTPPGQSAPALVGSPQVGGNAILAPADSTHAAVLLSGGAFQIQQTVANNSGRASQFRVSFFFYAGSQLITSVTVTVAIGPNGRAAAVSPTIFAEGPSGAAPVARDVRVAIEADDGASVAQAFYGVFYVQDGTYVPPTTTPPPLLGILYATQAASSGDEAIILWKAAHPADTFASIAPTDSPYLWTIGYYPALGPPAPG